MLQNMDVLVGRMVDPWRREISAVRLSWHEGRIVDIASVTDTEASHGPFILPGFVDAHVHVESSMLPPAEFARLAMAHGTVASVSDPHEIANVLGRDGVDYMLQGAAKSPFHFCFGAPSCVPATAFETAGAELGPAEVSALLEHPSIGYLAEVMNYPGVINGQPDVLEKIRIAHALGKPVDGHCPGLRGDGLAAYAAAGITTDHECFQLDEALEKIGHGMKILIREGSAARNFDALAPLLGSHPASCMFCSDDKHPDALAAGHIDRLVAAAVERGYDVFDVLRAACVHPVEHYGLATGRLRKGDPADFITVRDLNNFEVTGTWLGGSPVARDGGCLLPFEEAGTPNAFHPRPIGPDDFRLPERKPITRVIEVFDGQLVTAAGRIPSRLLDDPDGGILKIAVINRYHDAPPAVAFVRNVGLRRGAIASTVAHDCHNIVAVGASDADLAQAVNALMASRGGCVIADGGRTELLPLPIAGLMSNEPGASVATRYEELTRMAQSLGSPLAAPFMTLSFLALLVIPELKLSDRGLFDGRAFEFVPVFEEP